MSANFRQLQEQVLTIQKEKNKLQMDLDRRKIDYEKFKVRPEIYF